MIPLRILQTGQNRCYDTDGREISCTGTGQDAELKRGAPWPQNRFSTDKGIVVDRLTGLTWTRSANLTGFPVVWEEGLAFVSEMNRGRVYGFDAWRLPNRRELRSLLSHQTKNPALPEDHPFENVFLGWYWTSSSAAINPSYAWYVHMEGARMFYGKKDEYHLLWPVYGRSPLLPCTGQKKCYDSGGFLISCEGSGQDGEFQYGQAMPQARFIEGEKTIIDLMSGLIWMKDADLATGPVSWREAFRAVEESNEKATGGIRTWRLPNIQELESLVDLSAFGPALSPGHPFWNVKEVYWSSTTSVFSPDWAWALYMYKGAVGVGLKKTGPFHVWAVSDLSP